MPASIHIHGARTHNLRDLTLRLPRGAWTVVCGVSGSGKSSLVLDTLGAESRRRFLGTQRRGAGHDLPVRPDVDRIEGLPPAVTAGFMLRAPSVRETLGTITEITHALRAMFMRAAVPHCPACHGPVDARTREGILATLLAHPDGTRLVLVAPHGVGPDAVETAAREGFVRVRVGEGAVRRIEDVDAASVGADAAVDVVVDRLVVKPEAADRFGSSIDQALAIGSGRLTVLAAGGGDGLAPRTYADRPYCGACRITYPALSTAVFSFNSPTGACPACQGRGTLSVLQQDDVLPPHLRLSRLPSLVGPSLPPAEREGFAARVQALIDARDEGRRTTVAGLTGAQRKKLLGGLLAVLETHGRSERIASKQTCAACEGARLRPYARAAKLGDRSLYALEALALDELHDWVARLTLPEPESDLVAPARADLLDRLTFLRDVGLGYLAAARPAGTLSTGELRRARLAAACAARMSGLLYLLDEPTAGLHPADRPALATRLRTLVEEGNTVVCVEHDGAMIRAADHLLELGPGAGADGGRVVTEGGVADVLAGSDAPTAVALRAKAATLRAEARDGSRWVALEGATRHNLRGVDCRFPAVGLTAVTGVSGAGKSTLTLDVLVPAVRARLASSGDMTGLAALRGIDAFEHLAVAGSSAPRHARATAGSVLGALAPIRTLFAATLEARARGWAASWFSTNVDGGRCDACKGTGSRAVALRDLPEHRVPCDVCDGTRFRAETGRVRVKGLSIADVLALPIAEAAEVFRHIPRARRALAAADDVGLGYIPLGEPTTRVSGGEALRLRLAAALGRGRKRGTLYVLDEPCAGLHPGDVEHLVAVLLRLAAAGNAVLAVEHHASLIRRADHVIDLGPGPGDLGGRVVYQGPPAGLAQCAESSTARFL